MTVEGSRRDRWWHVTNTGERATSNTELHGVPAILQKGPISNKRAQLQTTAKFQSTDLSHKSIHICKKKTVATPV